MLQPGLCTFSRADPWATCAAAFCVFLRNPCKLLKTLGWLCIEFYALVPLFQRSVSIDRSMHDFYWVFALPFKDRCKAEFPCGCWFCRQPARVAIQTQFPQAGRVSSRERA